MGASSSKIEGEYLPSTPPTLKIHSLETREHQIPIEIDPRSPTFCRTPLNEVLSKNQPMTRNQDLTNLITPIHKPTNLLKSKLLRNLGINFLDPRSPTEFINRTPIVFNENDPGLNVSGDSNILDNTFADLMVENKYRPEEDTVSQAAAPIVVLPTPPTSVTTSKDNQESEIDPRSPSRGVERTPVIFSDDAPSEDDLIENFLDTLTLKENQPIENKPLERLKNAKPRPSSSPRNKIYEDNVQVFSSPKRSAETTLQSVSVAKRTPLSCLANKPHTRSKSAESLDSERKPKIPRSSFDDHEIQEKTPFRQGIKKKPLSHTRIPVLRKV